MSFKYELIAANKDFFSSNCSYYPTPFRDDTVLGRKVLRIVRSDRMLISGTIPLVSCGSYRVEWRLKFDRHYFCNCQLLVTVCVKKPTLDLSCRMPRIFAKDSDFAVESSVEAPFPRDKSHWVTMPSGEIQICGEPKDVCLKFWILSYQNTLHPWWKSGSEIGGLNIDSVRLVPCNSLNSVIIKLYYGIFSDIVQFMLYQCC